MPLNSLFRSKVNLGVMPPILVVNSVLEDLTRNAQETPIVMPIYHVLVLEIYRMYFHLQVRLDTQLLILHQVTNIVV